MTQTKLGLQELTRRVEEAADKIHDPCALGSGMQIGMTSMGLIRSVEASDGPEGWRVGVTIRFTGPECMNYFYFKQNLLRCIGELEGVASVTVDFEAKFDWEPSMMSADAQSQFEKRTETLQQLHVNTQKNVLGSRPLF